MTRERFFNTVIGLFSAGQDQRQSASYRADIDGLRAIAVGAVVLFHLDFMVIGGGFVGVDIFFVISGYLIGKSILDQRRAGTFSLPDFYQRRLRRIFPALVMVLTLTTLAALFILFPVSLQDYGRSLTAAVFSISNITFWLDTGYFDAEAMNKPLLHTWSLGVEEQFYLLFPLMLLFSRRDKTIDSWLIGISCLASLAFSIAISSNYPSANFYLIPTRAWELVVGVIAAETRLKLLERRFLREIIAAVALGAIAWTCFNYHESMVFPGLSALLPTLATAALLTIGAHGPTLIGKLLSLKPAVWIGLISYSLYLWHWPVIVFIKQWMPEAWLRMPHRVFALGISIGLAGLSWRFVERPFRSRQISDRAIWILSASAAALLALAGVAIVAADGWPDRFAPKIAKTASYLERPEEAPKGSCQVTLFAKPGSFAPDDCLIRASDRPNVLIIGDSHGSHLRDGLIERYPQIAFQQATAAGCRMTIEGAGNETPTCAAFRKELFGKRLPADPPRWVVIGLFWGEHPFKSLRPTVEWLKSHGIKVIVAGPLPRYEVALPLVLARSAMRQDPDIIRRSRIPGAQAADAKFANFAAENGVEYMSSYSAICSNGTCLTGFADGEPVQHDSHHLGSRGSLLVASAFPAEAVIADWQAQSSN